MRPIIFTASFSFLLVTVTYANQQRVELGNVTGGKQSTANSIINKKCTTCHSREKIDMALSKGIDLKEIQSRMEKKGVKLNSNERDVLGVFWQHSKPVTIDRK